MIKKNQKLSLNKQTILDLVKGGHPIKTITLQTQCDTFCFTCLRCPGDGDTIVL